MREHRFSSFTHGLANAVFHATLVPIVTGERRKAKKEQAGIKIS